MTKFVKCIDDRHEEEFLTKGKIYEVIDINNDEYFINTDNVYTIWFYKTKFEEVKQEETKFRFISKSEITEVTVDGIEGILIKE